MMNSALRIPSMALRTRHLRVRGSTWRPWTQPSTRTLSSGFSLAQFQQNRLASASYTKQFLLPKPEPLKVRLTLRIGPEFLGCNLNARFLHGSGTSSEKSSSKIEETVKRLKEKQEETQTNTVATADGAIPKTVIEKPLTGSLVAKKTIWQKIVSEAQHYYSGFKLLFLDVRVSTAIVWKILNGKTLSRRESKQLVRTTSDLFRLVPFSVFIIVPFMEFLLPVALKLFPGMLPSTFTTKSEREAKMKRTLTAKLEYAKFLQKTLDDMAPSDTKSRDSKSASDFVEFYQKIKTQGSSIVNNEEILKYSKLFKDDITLDNMTRGQLSAICRLLELTPIGTSNFLRLQIEMRLRHLKADDQVILREGLNDMTVQELQVACKERGMRALGISEVALKRQLQEWLDLSQNAKVPPSLLLLSRTLYLSETAPPTEQIAATISALPESAATATKVQIGEREGKIRNVERLEQIKEEQRKIKEEADEEIKLTVQKKKADEATITAKKAVLQAVLTEAAKAGVEPHKVSPEVLAAQAPSVETLVKEAIGTLRKATVTSSGELKEDLIDTAPILIDKAEVMQESVKEVDIVKGEKDKQFNTSDLSDLKSAIESLGKPAKLNVEEIKNLKKELEDYEEDLKNLDSAKESSNRFTLIETKGAKRLFNRVNKMLTRVDVLVQKLEAKEKEITDEQSRDGRTVEEVEKDAEKLVTVQELIEAVIKLQQTPDSSKLKQISEVLSMMDVDEDGVIDLDHVNKVIELIGMEHINLPAKQIKQIIEMMAKEEMLDMEKNIAHILGTSDNSKVSDDSNPDEKKVDSQPSDKREGSPDSDDHLEDEKTTAKLKNNGGKTQK